MAAKGCIQTCSYKETKSSGISVIFDGNQPHKEVLASEVQKCKVATSCAKTGTEKCSFMQMPYSVWKRNNTTCVDSHRENKKNIIQLPNCLVKAQYGTYKIDVNMFKILTDVWTFANTLIVNINKACPRMYVN